MQVEVVTKVLGHAHVLRIHQLVNGALISLAIRGGSQQASCMQTPYLHFIYQLIRTFRSRDMVMLECRHVSLSMCHRAVSPDVVCEAIAEVLRRNRWSQAAFIGHSYGTFVLSRMVQLHRDVVESMVSITLPSVLSVMLCQQPQVWHSATAGFIERLHGWNECMHVTCVGMQAVCLCIWLNKHACGTCAGKRHCSCEATAAAVSRHDCLTPCTSESRLACACMQVLLDPVCMFTIWPQLLQNFIYKLPHLGGGILGLIDGARSLFSRDLVIAEAFCRKFVWHKVSLQWAPFYASHAPAHDSYCP